VSVLAAQVENRQTIPTPLSPSHRLRQRRMTPGNRGLDTLELLGRLIGDRKGRRPVDARRLGHIKRLAEEGTVWLRRVPVQDRHHTFTMITFENGKPFVYVVSNFERPNGPKLSTPADELFVTRIRPRGPRCIVTGWTPAVCEADKEALKDALAHQVSPNQIRQAVARTSRESSTRAQGKVGESCVVAHLLPDGSGEAQVSGIR